MNLPPALAALPDAFKVAAAKHKGVKARLAILSRDLNVLYTTTTDDPPAGMMAKIVVSKARSFFDGKTLKNPNGCTIMCCYM